MPSFDEVEGCWCNSTLTTLSPCSGQRQSALVPMPVWWILCQDQYLHTEIPLWLNTPLGSWAVADASILVLGRVNTREALGDEEKCPRQGVFKEKNNPELVQNLEGLHSPEHPMLSRSCNSLKTSNFLQLFAGTTWKALPPPILSFWFFFIETRHWKKIHFYWKQDMRTVFACVAIFFLQFAPGDSLFFSRT